MRFGRDIADFSTPAFVYYLINTSSLFGWAEGGARTTRHQQCSPPRQRETEFVIGDFGRVLANR
jgi:hypothetical protein